MLNADVTNVAYLFQSLKNICDKTNYINERNGNAKLH